ncbi:MAG: GGDEF domain-containing protein [Acetobacteraceae bacterium]|nr:GGDEF domain-containing protein [Acetobacteraceae bacterium]
MHDIAAAEAPPKVSPAELLQGALLDSRQRWRDLVSLVADFVFETDEWGCFTMAGPDPALAWDVSTLMGQSSASLLAEGGGGVFNPFRVTARVRHRRAWLKRGDGGIACIMFCAAPIWDVAGRVTGARGIGIDMTELDGQAAQVAATLRRAEVLDHILWRMGQEVMAPRMMAAALDALTNALGAEGAAVLLLPSGETGGRLAHVTGTGVEAVIDTAVSQLRSGETGPTQIPAPGGNPVLCVVCKTKSSEKTGLIVWRGATGRAWDRDDSLLIASASNIVRMVLEHDAVQYEMASQARTDSLTGLLNRRAFLEEVERHVTRLDRELQPGTLIFADLDHFKPVNDRLGHETGDRVLQVTAALLRKTFRPGDLVARLGGDEFAVWLNGADHMTAAERAEFLRDAVPRELTGIIGPDGPRLTMSIGIASREPGTAEPLDSVMRRADMAMYEVKRGGRGHWRVSLRKRS